MQVSHAGIGERSRALGRVYLKAVLQLMANRSKSSRQCGTRQPPAVYPTGREHSEGIATWSSLATS